VGCQIGLPLFLHEVPDDTYSTTRPMRGAQAGRLAGWVGSLEKLTGRIAHGWVLFWMAISILSRMMVFPIRSRPPNVLLMTPLIS